MVLNSHISPAACRSKPEQLVAPLNLPSATNIKYRLVCRQKHRLAPWSRMSVLGSIATQVRNPSRDSKFQLIDKTIRVNKAEYQVKPSAFSWLCWFPLRRWCFKTTWKPTQSLESVCIIHWKRYEDTAPQRRTEIIRDASTQHKTLRSDQQNVCTKDCVAGKTFRESLSHKHDFPVNLDPAHTDKTALAQGHNSKTQAQQRQVHGPAQDSLRELAVN